MLPVEIQSRLSLPRMVGPGWLDANPYCTLGISPSFSLQPVHCIRRRMLVFLYQVLSTPVLCIWFVTRHSLSIHLNHLSGWTLYQSEAFITATPPYRHTGFIMTCQPIGDQRQSTHQCSSMLISSCRGRTVVLRVGSCRCLL